MGKCNSKPSGRRPNYSDADLFFGSIGLIGFGS